MSRAMGRASGTLAPMSARVREALDGAERRAWREIETFEQETPSMASSVLKVAAAPFQAVVPDAVGERMHAALETLVEAVQQVDEWGISPEIVLAGSPYGDLAQLRREGDIALVRGLIDRQTRPAVLKATLQGAGLGFGGVLLAVADVPLLMISHLRLLTAVGLCCGIDLRSPGERPFVLALLKLGYCLSDWVEKRTSIEELWKLMQEQPPSAAADSEVARRVLFKSIGAFSDKIAPILIRRRAGAMVPLIGSAFGAGSNYYLTQDVAAAARHTLVKRFLLARVRAREGQTGKRGSS